MTGVYCFPNFLADRRRWFFLMPLTSFPKFEFLKPNARGTS